MDINIEIKKLEKERVCMNLSEIINEFMNGFSIKLDNTISIPEVIATILSLLGALISVWGWMKSKAHSKQAKIYEEKAREYADNADKANIALQNYYTKAYENIESEKQEKILELKILGSISDHRMIKLDRLCNLIDEDEPKIIEMLKKLESQNKIKNHNGNATEIEGKLWVKTI